VRRQGECLVFCPAGRQGVKPGRLHAVRFTRREELIPVERPIPVERDVALL
jgi:hypothetical protein